MNAVERFDAETEADVAEWVPPELADEYRAQRRTLMARSFAQFSDAIYAESGAILRGMASVSRQINESVERMRRR